MYLNDAYYSFYYLSNGGFNIRYHFLNRASNLKSLQNCYSPIGNISIERSIDSYPAIEFCEQITFVSFRFIPFHSVVVKVNRCECIPFAFRLLYSVHQYTVQTIKKATHSLIKANSNCLHIANTQHPVFSYSSNMYSKSLCMNFLTFDLLEWARRFHQCKSILFAPSFDYGH